MTQTKEPSTKQRSLLKGVIAGMIGGIIATAARTYAERLYPSDSPTGPRLVTGDSALAIHKPSEPVNWGLGALTGAAYGGVAEFFPAATERSGASFGLVLGSMMQRVQPQLPATAAEPERSEASAMTANVVYGVVTETVRSTVRHFL